MVTPSGGLLGAWSHDVIHSLDVTEGLGLPAGQPGTDSAGLGSPKLSGAFNVDMAGRKLTATDLDGLAVGKGTEVLLPAKDILLVLTNRRPVPAVPS